MRTYVKQFLMCAFILLTAGTLWPQTDTPSASPVKRELARLSTPLSLTPPQMNEVERILTMIHKQAEKDGQSFKGNPDALIGAAKRRLMMRDNLIQNLLSPRQMYTFMQMKEDRNNDVEFTIWKEGLSLTELQSVKLRVIIDRSAKEMQTLRVRQQHLAENQRGLMDGSMRDNPRYNQTGVAGDQGRAFRLNAVVDTVNQYKAKEIKKLLTPEQMKFFKKVNAIVDRERRIMEKRDLEKRQREKR